MSQSQKEPDVTVCQRVDVSLSGKEVEHAIRCWVALTLVERMSVPPAKDFSSVFVSISADETGNALGATVTYEPTPSPTSNGGQGDAGEGA